MLTGVNGEPLGELVPAGRSFNSVCSGTGPHGGPFGAASIFNEFSNYGGPFGANSPFNLMSVQPPGIVVGGVLSGHLTVSPFVSSPVDTHAMLAFLGCPAA